MFELLSHCPHDSCERERLATSDHSAYRSARNDTKLLLWLRCSGGQIEVNTLSGQDQVLQVISVHDVGRAINRQQVEGQIEGCLAQALGYALLEHFKCAMGIS